MSTHLPAEWAPQRAIMLTWPRADGDFARHFAEVEQAFIAIALSIGRYEPLHINYSLEPQILHARLIAAGMREDRVRIFQVPSDDVWARDHGPITVFRCDRPVHLDFRFNGWGGKFPAEQDNQLTRNLAALGAWSAPVEPVDFVLEGGGIESDGAGTLLATERCLLSPTRNPRFDKAGIEAMLKGWLGAQRVLWLKHGDLLGDDTDGHIDTLARFCDAQTIAYQACDAADPHFAELQAMAEELRAFRRADGAPYRLLPLPLPAPIHDEDGRRLPAGYANFLILNGAVLVPQYGSAAQDTCALESLKPYFPRREVVGIDCRSLIRQYGSLHCITMQIPADR